LELTIVRFGWFDDLSAMKITLYALAAAGLLFCSCEAIEHTHSVRESTLEASIDFAKLQESGDSKITYDGKTKTNVVVYTDWYFLELPLRDYHLNSALREEDPKTAPSTDNKISLRYGLEYIGKGAKFPGGNGDFGINLNYLSVPFDAIYHHPAGPGQIEGGLGPYFAYGIGGSSGGVSSFGEDNGGFKRFDAGLNLQMGYKLDNGLSFRLAYDLGLANVEYASEDVKGHTRAFSINIGYQIGKLFGKK
jgi:Outer membrane protein beta-barrel domain